MKKGEVVGIWNGLRCIRKLDLHGQSYLVYERSSEDATGAQIWLPLEDLTSQLQVVESCLLGALEKLSRKPRPKEDLFITSKVVAKDDPPFYVDLPNDYDTVYIQILTKADSTGRFVTTDPAKYSILADPSRFCGTKLGSTFNTTISVDSSLFPQDNEDILAGNFILRICCTRKSLTY